MAEYWGGSVGQHPMHNGMINQTTCKSRQLCAERLQLPPRWVNVNDRLHF